MDQAVLIDDLGVLAAMGTLITMRECMQIAAPDEDNPQGEVQQLRAQKTQLQVQLSEMNNAFSNHLNLFQVLNNLDVTLSRVKARLAELERGARYRLHVIGRIEANYHNHLVDAQYLEVNDMGSMMFAQYLRETAGWRGTACFEEDIEENLRDQMIMGLLDAHIPILVKTYVMDDVVLVPLPMFPDFFQG